MHKRYTKTSEYINDQPLYKSISEALINSDLQNYFDDGDFREKKLEMVEETNYFEVPDDDEDYEKSYNSMYQ